MSSSFASLKSLIHKKKKEKRDEAHKFIGMQTAEKEPNKLQKQCEKQKKWRRLVSTFLFIFS